MNAADRHRLTPVLGAGATGLALLLIALWAGLGRGVHWQSDAAPPKLPPPGAILPPPPVPPIGQFAAIWQHPLFSPTRTPARVHTAKASADLVLTGVVMSPGLEMAIVHDKSTGKDYRVIQGRPATGHPALIALQPRSAVLATSGAHWTLQLAPGSSPDAAGAAPAEGAAFVAPGARAPPPAAAVGAAGRGRRVDRGPPVGQQGSRTRQTAPNPGQAKVEALRARIEALRRRARQGGGQGG